MLYPFFQVPTRPLRLILYDKKSFKIKDLSFPYPFTLKIYEIDNTGYALRCTIRMIPASFVTSYENAREGYHPSAGYGFRLYSHRKHGQTNRFIVR